MQTKLQPAYMKRTDTWHRQNNNIKMDKMYLKKLNWLPLVQDRDTNKSSSSIKASGILTSQAILRTLPYGIFLWMWCMLPKWQKKILKYTKIGLFWI